MIKVDVDRCIRDSGWQVLLTSQNVEWTERSCDQHFFEMEARMAGSPKETHSAITAAAQMYHGMES
jgi:hypothetical protein